MIKKDVQDKDFNNVESFMNIDFFEEFPTEENLKKAQLISFPATIYLAAENLSQYKNAQMLLESYNPALKSAYWPLLAKSYWFSPFSHQEELAKLYLELQEKPQKETLSVLLDLELPFLNKKLFFINWRSFRHNKKMIQQYFQDSQKLNIAIMTAEYPLPTFFWQRLMEWLGISFSPKKYPHQKILMYYTSIIPQKYLPFVRWYLKRKIRRYGSHLQIALGTITTGIFGNEPILIATKLDEELAFLQKQGIEKVVIFRLGGLDHHYMEILKKYVS